MKPQNIRRVANAIERGTLTRGNMPMGFNMGFWVLSGLSDGRRVDVEHRDCGTVACVAGSTCALFDGDPYAARNNAGIEARARELLGLTDAEGRDMFRPWITWPYLYGKEGQIRVADAVGVMRAAARTGIIDWLPVVARLQAEEAKAAAYAPV